MNDDMKRRRAAEICFTPYLTEDQLITALEVLEQNFQQDGVTNIISYINKICLTFGIDMAIRKALYGQFHELMTEKFSFTASAAAPQASAYVAPSNPAVAASAPTPRVAMAAGSQTKQLIHVIVFINFMRHLMVYVPSQTEFFNMLTELSKDKKNGSKLMEMFVTNWRANPNDFQWTEDLPEKRLADVVHLVYTALCEIFGPIDADDYFHKAMALCEREPESRQFPPSRFL